MPPSPSLNALRAFEAAARHLSFTRAARELHVTQAAVSHQLRLLEGQIGLRLFQRLPRRLVLTAAGEAYARALGRAFARIEEATSALHARPAREILTITTLPSFATLWLVPRLAAFVARRPETDIRVHATARQADFSLEAIDVGIRYGYGQYGGLQVEKLLDESCFPVCSPALLRRGSRGKRGLDLSGQTLLHDESSEAWQRWFRAFPAAGASPERGHVFNDASLMLQAAADGLGVAMGRAVLAKRDLASGRLVRPFAGELPCDEAYYLVTSEHTAGLAKVAAFRSWIRAEASSELARSGAARPSRRSKR